MSKHIHIHLPKGLTVTRTKDAGFNEADHKRDHGKFATTTGGAEHHDAAAKKHDEARAALPSMHDDKHHHMKASMRHEEAAQYLRAAAKAKAAGHHELAAEHHKNAEVLAQHAKKHEAELSTAPAAAPSKGIKPTPGAPRTDRQATPGKHAARLPVGSHVIHAAGAYAGKVVGHEGEHVSVQKSGEEPRKLLGGLLRPDTARHIDPKSAATAYKGTHAGPLHISSSSTKK